MCGYRHKRYIKKIRKPFHRLLLPNKNIIWMIKIILLNRFIGGDELLTETQSFKYPKRQSVMMGSRYIQQNFAIERKPEIFMVGQIVRGGIQILEFRLPLSEFANMVLD